MLGTLPRAVCGSTTSCWLHALAPAHRPAAASPPAAACAATPRAPRPAAAAAAHLCGGGRGLEHVVRAHARGQQRLVRVAPGGVGQQHAPVLAHRPGPRLGALGDQKVAPACGRRSGGPTALSGSVEARRRPHAAGAAAAAAAAAAAGAEAAVAAASEAASPLLEGARTGQRRAGQVRGDGGRAGRGLGGRRAAGAWVAGAVDHHVCQVRQQLASGGGLRWDEGCKGRRV
jgi:hypothetical protein